MSNTALSNINSTVLQFLESNNISNQDLVSLWMENDVQNKLKANIKSKSKSLESKRKPSAYLLFCQEHRAKVKDFLLKENPDLKSLLIPKRKYLQNLREENLLICIFVTILEKL